jgi:hypothetical protein
VSFIRKHSRLTIVAVACALVGAGASAIATAGAVSSSPTNAHHARGHRPLLARSVHGQAVVATRTGFVTITFDRGFVQSVSGQQLTIREGTRTRTYKTVTLSVPTNARVRDDGSPGSLSDVKSGQRVAVVQGPNRTWVIARDVRNP